MLRDPGRLRRCLVGWLRGLREQAGDACRGFAFGLSGGIDSAVVCALAAEAVGPDRCLGLIMPIESHPEDAELARAVADRFRVRAATVELSEAYHELLAAVVDAPADGGELVRANVKPRLRMVALYYYANLLRYFVLGTGNRDELAMGYYTKWGDGACDALPLGDLVKAEVRAVARVLGVPGAVLERAPSAGLWPGQTDEQEMGIRYEQLDRYLVEGSSGEAGVDAAIRRRQQLARHKASPPAIARPE
jgi:NAD+ synthase